MPENVAELKSRAIELLSIPEGATDEQITEYVSKAKAGLEPLLALITPKSNDAEKPATTEEKVAALHEDSELAKALGRFNEIAAAPIQRRAEKAHNDHADRAHAKPVAYADIAARKAQTDWERACKAAADEVHMVGAVFCGINWDKAEGGIKGIQPAALEQLRQTKAWARYEDILGMGPEQVKAAISYSTSAGYGDEWVPTLVSPDMIDEARLGYNISGLFARIPMPSNPYVLPYNAQSLVAYLVGESTTDTGNAATLSILGTAKVTLTAIKFGVKTQLSEELDEDSFTPIVPILMQQLVTALVEAEEYAICNGDTTATHMDADLESAGASSRACAWNGLRDKAITNSATADLGTFSAANVRSLREKLGKFGVDPRACAFGVNAVGLNKLMGLDVVSTFEKFGANATVIKGTLAMFDGIPVVLSDAVRTGLNASGVQDGVTQTKTVMHLFNHRAFVIGERRGIRVRVVGGKEDIEAPVMVASVRETFEQVQTRSTGNDPSVLGYNF